MITKAMILAHAATVGLTCTAVEVAPPVYKAVKARVQGHYKPAVRHYKPRVAKAVPVCPPSGIVTIGTIQNYTRPLVPIDTVNGTSVESGREAKGYGYGQSSGGYSAIGGYNGIGTGSFGSGANTPSKPPVVLPTPTPSALPEPGTWAMMLAGFGMVGLVARSPRRVGTASNVGE